MEDVLREERLKKIQQLKEKGIDPYGERYQPVSFISEIKRNWDPESEEEKKVKTAGRLKSIRFHGKTIFSHIQDSTDNIQLYFRKDKLGEQKFEILKMLNVGDIIGVEGILFKTKTGEITIFVDNFMLLSKSIRPLPEKWHGLKDVETRYRKRYLDLICNSNVREIFITRSKIIKCIREYLDSKGFIEVETPMMHSIPAGAEARPFKTYHNALNMELYLRIAPELYLKRLLVGGLDRVYEINRNFRNEGISTKHNPEFTMIEIYQAYADYRDMMELTEELITEVINKCIDKEIVYKDKKIDFSRPWPRYSYMELLEKHGIDLDNEEKIREKAQQFNIPQDTSIEDMVDKLFQYLIEDTLINPTFIIDYPANMCPLAKTKKNNPSIAERFELYIAGMEVANAYTELNDPIIQKENFLKQAKAKGEDKIDEDYIEALEYGMPPAGGLGIGIDRLVMILTSVSTIRDVILFPLLKPIEDE